MAAKCSIVHDDVYDLMKDSKKLKKWKVDSWTIEQLDNASTRLLHVYELLEQLERSHPENAISQQLGPLFAKAHKAFNEMVLQLKDQPRRHYTIPTIVSNVLKMTKLGNDKASEASRLISDVLEIFKMENIVERIEVAKASRSSCNVTKERVDFVKTLLDYTTSYLSRLKHRGPMFMLQKKLQYLRVLFTLVAEWCVSSRDRVVENMKDFLIHVEDVAYSAALVCLLEIESNMDSKFSELLEMMSPFRPQVRQIYLSVLIGLKSSMLINTNYMSDFLIILQEDLQEVLSFDDRILWLQDQLSYLPAFLLDIASKCTPLKQYNFLQLHIGALAIESAVVIYSFYDEEMGKNTEIDRMLFHLQAQFKHVKVEFDLIQLLNSQATIIVPLKNLIDYVWRELVFLSTFFMVAFKQCKEQTRITDLLTLIQSVTGQAWSFINCLSHDSRKISSFHFQLFLKFKFIKAAIRQMCEVIDPQCYPSMFASSILVSPPRPPPPPPLPPPPPPLPSFLPSPPPNYMVIDPAFRSTIPASSTPTINLLNFLPINFEVIDSFLNMLKSSKTSSTDITAIDEVLMEFHEYILDNLLLKDETYLAFTVANEVKKFYYGLLLLVTYLSDPLDQCIGCMKQNDLLTGFRTKVIEAESSLCLINEHAVDSNKSRKVNLVLQFLTIAFKLIESEESLMDLLKHKSTLEAQILDLIESAHEEIVFVRAFLMDVLTQLTELNILKNLLMHAEVTAQKLAQVSGSCYENFMERINSEKMRFWLSDLLQEIESIKVEFRKVCFQLLDASPCNMADGKCLINFLLNHRDRVVNCDAFSISILKNKIPVFKDKLVYLGSFLADIVQYRDMSKELKDLMKCVQVRKLVCLFHIKDYRPAWYYMLYLSDVKQLLKFVEAEVERICLNVPDSSSYGFPKINGLGFLDCFLGKLEELLSSKLDTVIGLKLQLGLVKEGLLCLRSLADLFAESNDEHDGVCSFITSVTEMAYRVEYVTDSCLTCSHPLWYKVLWISEVVSNIKLVIKVANETWERKKIDLTVHKVKSYSTDLVVPLSANTPGLNEETEGFEKVMDQIKKQLLGGSHQLDLISLVGMPGIGKTTLAEKIYDDRMVTSHFDVRAKCRVTQVYSWRDLLLTILNGVLEPVDRNEKEDGELADELCQFLLTKRFLILIDDVWDTKVWDSFYTCFKDARNGCRIILTTRMSNIASYAQCGSELHHLRLRTDDESWTLLQEEVFQGDSCPPELHNMGFQIAKCCGGLPLFIVLVAGVLRKIKRKAELWKEIAETLGSQNIGSLEESMSMIGFSYKNLPHQLKPCFLYFGGLLNRKDINVSKLTRFWVAEEFVQANLEKGPEEVALGFLEDLISRNLVMGVEKRPNGKLKTCRIHDLLHKFCLEKAKQENFFHRINRFSGEDTFPEKPKEYRLFVHSYEDQIDLWQPSCSNVRSLLFNVIDPGNFLWPRDMSFIFDSFKLVKVLDLESFNIGGTFPSEIQYLIHLRYFAAQTGGNSIPSSIAKLRNLETFVVKGLGVEVMLPSSFLKMVKLRHIHVKLLASFSLYENIVESLPDFQLDNLESFSTPHLSYGEDTEMILRKMPKLRKLSCIFSGTFGYSNVVMGRCVLFPRLEFLSHLESLKLVSNSYPAKLPHVFSFPLKLRELTLSKFRLPWNQISTIAKLPNLVILKLFLKAFEGAEWEVGDLEFPELKYLEMGDLDIAHWSVSCVAFPMLEHLVLTKCKQLKEIPSHFDGVTSLRRIEVNWCSWSVANSAQELQIAQHEDMENDAFTVTIHPPDWARRSSA